MSELVLELGLTDASTYTLPNTFRLETRSLGRPDASLAAVEVGLAGLRRGDGVAPPQVVRLDGILWADPPDITTVRTTAEAIRDAVGRVASLRVNGAVWATCERGELHVLRAGHGMARLAILLYPGVVEPNAIPPLVVSSFADDFETYSNGQDILATSTWDRSGIGTNARLNGETGTLTTGSIMARLTTANQVTEDYFRHVDATQNGPIYTPFADGIATYAWRTIVNSGNVVRAFGIFMRYDTDNPNTLVKRAVFGRMRLVINSTNRFLEILEVVDTVQSTLASLDVSGVSADIVNATQHLELTCVDDQATLLWRDAGQVELASVAATVSVLDPGRVGIWRRLTNNVNADILVDDWQGSVYG